MNPGVAVPCVLVADDQSAVRDLFSSFLRRAGFDVDVACDGLEAVERLRLRVPDAVVCDLDMPHMDGLALYRAMRAEAATSAVPIVIVSGGGGLGLGRALGAGCDAVLAKPCSGALVVATVARLLGRASPSLDAPAYRCAPLESGGSVSKGTVPKSVMT